MKKVDEIKKEVANQLADIALELGAIKLQVSDPFTWASGYRMPIYNDNRKLLASPKARLLIATAFEKICVALDFDPENIAGTATAGIPHATTLADKLNKSLSYVRSSSKDHGLNQKIEGLGASRSYEGKSVLLIEDLISTGGSSIKAVKAIVEADGVCPYTLAIFTYGLEASKTAFESLDPKCEYISILDYDTMVQRALEIKYINEDEALALKQWREDPFSWGINRGFERVSK
ncbi:MAG: orotate phosphoribosyltransferase [Sphaerochaetaceae bacterium]|nr:orotate phosphoribosyltransferase [Sphaerochaetaceae bacterium]